MTWIPVDVALPLPHKKILIFTTMGMHFGYLFTIHQEVFWEIGYLVPMGRVTHWMPPPAPPANQEN